MKFAKKITALALSIAMICCLAACSGGNTQTKAAETTAAQSAQSATPTIDAIKAKGKLTVLTNASFPPFEYIDAQGKVAGVDLDASQKIADKLGVELEVIDMDFDLLIDALKNGKGDLVAAGMTRTDDRAEIIDFSIIYISMGLKVVVPAKTDIKTFDDLDGKKVAVQEATTADIYVQENYKKAAPMQFKSAIDAVNAVKSGNADCAVIDMLPAEYMTANSDEIVLMEGLLSAEDTAMGVAKGHEDFLAVVNEVLDGIMKDGSLTESFNKHMENFSLE